MADLTLSASEQRYIFENPQAIALLMIYHDLQQDQADSMGAECHGNAIRCEELKAHGRAIVLQDPDVWDDETLRAFDVPRPAGVDVPAVIDMALLEFAAKNGSAAAIDKLAAGVAPSHQLDESRQLRSALTHCINALDALTAKVGRTGFQDSDEFTQALDALDIGRAAAGAAPTDGGKTNG
jgi:hypothetical protein